MVRKAKRKAEKLIPVADQKVYVAVGAVVALHEECQKAYNTYMATPVSTHKKEKADRLDYCVGLIRALDILGLPAPAVGIARTGRKLEDLRAATKRALND